MYKIIYISKDHIYKCTSPDMATQKCTKLATYSSLMRDGHDWIALAMDNQGSCKNEPSNLASMG